MKAPKSRRMWQQAVGLLPGFVLAGNLLIGMNAMANEGGATFKVEIGHLSENVRALVHSHGWSLEWVSDEDRIIIRPFDVANPSLDVALSKIFAPYKGTFSTALDQEKKVVRVTTASQGAPEEGISDSEGEEGLRWSKELDFEPDLESTTPPEPPPFEGEKKTVRMLDLPQAWESEGAEPVTPKPADVAKQQTPAIELSSKQEVRDGQDLESSEALADPQDRVVSDEKQESAPEKPETASSPASPEPVLQILSVKDKGKAEKELARLRDLGHDVFLEEFHHDGTLWHRLKMRLASEQSVEDAKAKLKGLGYDAVWIVPKDGK
ncbi:MAG: SPOR domain-containing protein [Gammaproteobacteria bacterium]|nr:SPOR domain-containing protein [Gammaproteobacteria bacterium]